MHVQFNETDYEAYFTACSPDEQRALDEFCELFRMGDELDLSYDSELGVSGQKELVLSLTRAFENGGKFLKIKAHKVSDLIVMEYFKKIVCDAKRWQLNFIGIYSENPCRLVVFCKRCG